MVQKASILLIKNKSSPHVQGGSTLFKKIIKFGHIYTVKSSYKMAHHSIEYNDQVLVIGREERLELRIFAGICFVH